MKNLMTKLIPVWIILMAIAMSSCFDKPSFHMKWELVGANPSKNFGVHIDNDIDSYYIPKVDISAGEEAGVVVLRCTNYSEVSIDPIDEAMQKRYQDIGMQMPERVARNEIKLTFDSAPDTLPNDQFERHIYVPISSGDANNLQKYAINIYRY